ncbi:SCO1664 family protein [Streptomyces ovatisporus]|uniref:SCO1664 family protein n=1 Tax=Streptomyces ovatisporus TaxID=1128682 RepID=A0ABV9AD41_9ACTN
MSKQAESASPSRPGRPSGSPADDETRRHLERGSLTVLGRIREASNAVLFGAVEHEGRSVPCVYKPVAGERPLWDFPDGTLAQREVAAYEISRAVGWDLIPATVLREGPHGQGMCQAWVGPLPGTDDEPADEPADGSGGGSGDGSGDGAARAPEASRDTGVPEDAGDVGEDADASAGEGLGDLLAVVEGDEPGAGWKTVGHVDTGGVRPALLVHADDARLRRLAVVDAVINNADRKGGHLLPVPGGRLYAIDHGVTFHVDGKLRTLLWGWAGEQLTAEAVAALRELAAELAEGTPLTARLSELITPGELDALRKRVNALRKSGRHPLPGGDWPAIPWPPV